MIATPPVPIIVGTLCGGFVAAGLRRRREASPPQPGGASPTGPGPGQGHS